MSEFDIIRQNKKHQDEFKKDEELFEIRLDVFMYSP